MNTTIWIVDDEEEIREIIKETLEEKGYKVMAVDKAVKAINAKFGDLVITDCHGVGKTNYANGVFILKCSGDPDMNPDLQKPFGMNELLNKVKEMLDKQEKKTA